MKVALTRRQEVLLAALAADPGAGFAPVQVQKMFFLLDENVAKGLGGRQFKFAPYDYGPFDKAVYQELDALERMGFVAIEQVSPYDGRRRYALTPPGQSHGERVLTRLPKATQAYILRVSKWVRSLSFAQLVGSIYKAYPRMRVNSIFQD